MAQKLEAIGSKAGTQWDDGSDHDSVAKVYVRGGLEGIQYVKFQYVKSGQLKDGIIHGVSGKGFTQMFEIDHPHDEYLVCVKGSYDSTSGVIQSLQFETNLRSSEFMGDDDKGTKFSLEFNRRKIIGFHGFAGTSLNSLGAYVIPATPTKSELVGGLTGGVSWDDGSNHDGVRKVYVTYTSTLIRSIDTDYVKNGQVVTSHHGSKNGETKEFAIDYPNEYLTSVEGTYNTIPSDGVLVVRSLIFKTSKGRVSPTYGFVSGTKFVLEKQGNVIVGFHGRDGGAFDAIGIYFAPIASKEQPYVPTAPPTKSELVGGLYGGIYWDDGSNHDGVRSVHVTFTTTHIRSMDIDYDKDGKVVTCLHGMKNGETQKFVVDFPNEYITSVEGTYNHIHEGNYLVLTSLIFKTSKGRTSQTFGLVTGTKFVLESKGNVIVGFHGCDGGSFDAIGVYFAPIASKEQPYVPPAPPTKSDLIGSLSGGVYWDDGPNHDGVRKVYVTYTSTLIRSIDTDYDKKGQVITSHHGSKNGETKEFAIDYPNEYLTSVEGTYNTIPDDGFLLVRSLIFKTSKGRVSPTYGFVSGTKFVLEKQGNVIVGFHGREGGAVDAIGVYFSTPPLSPPPPTVKLQGKGGDGGVSWDDGVFEGVRKIYIGQGDNGVAAVKFDYYNKSNQVVVGEDHGKKTMLGYEEFVLDYPSEYITAVEGCYDKIFGSETGVISMLKFKTNKRTSPPFGLESTSSFKLEKEGYKVVGFHGKASHELHQLGITVTPISK